MQLQYWLSHFKYNYWIIGSIVLLLLFFIVIRLNIVNLGLFTGGFAASSLQVILIVSFQIIYGYVYQMTGILITIFMVGLAIGAFYKHKIIKNNSFKNYSFIQFVIAGYSFLMPVILLLINDLSTNELLTQLIFILLSFTIALFVGIEFALVSDLRKTTVTNIAADNYSIDLIGSAIGALLTTAFLIPLLGIIQVCIIIGILNIISGFVTVIRIKN